MSATPLLDADFNRLTKTPFIAWPTLSLFIICLIAMGTFSYLGIRGALPYWSITLINSVFTYLLFSVVHDAIHRAISQVKWVNDALGYFALIFFGPLASLPVARWIHMKHHRFTNDSDKDPDVFGHKIDLLTPFRWAMFDVYYSWYYLTSSGAMRNKLLPSVIIQILLVINLFLIAASFGYALEALLFWLLPTRLSSILLVAFFVYLPHVPFVATAEDNEYKASNIRAGWEWLLTPLMAYQNYHLVHHLYPTAPCYRMIKIWNARLAEHLAHDPLYVAPFSLGKPVIPPNPRSRTIVQALIDRFTERNNP